MSLPPPPHTQLIAPVQQESLWVGFLHQNETFRGRRTRAERMDEVQRPVGKEISAESSGQREASR